MDLLGLPDGRIVLFMGGADSIDKKYRKIGFDWFPEELITQKDIYELPDTHGNIRLKKRSDKKPARTYENKK